MFRQFIKLSLIAPISHRKLASYGTRINLSRQFSSEMTANWPDGVKSFLVREKIDQPTLIQEKTLPVVMQNKDLVGIARTGSGKTLAFVIPAVMKILKEREEANNGERFATCLVLAPTRELASQTADVFYKFRNMGIRSVVLVGGSNRGYQVNELQRGNHDVYIATPGRLIDLMNNGDVDLSKIKYVVLDEADRMLDMGFEPQIRDIIDRVPKDRQTLMWSATWPEEIQTLAEEFMNNYEYVAVDSEKLKANPNIKQIIEVCGPRQKHLILLDHLDKFEQETERPRVLIFVNTKRLANQLLLQLMREKHRAITLHGDRSQKQRDDALKLFKNRHCNIMVATDVAARGLDISDISHVINYDFPNTIEDYIHRIGRTARHEKKGVSISFFTEDNVSLASKLIEVLKETNQEIPEKLLRLSSNSFSSRAGPSHAYRRPFKENMRRRYIFSD